MDCSTPGFSVCHQLPELTQTHVHRVGDAIQQSHPLSSPSYPAPNPSQHQGLFKWVNSLHQVAKLLEFQLQLKLNTQDWFPLGMTGLTPCCQKDSQESSPAPQFNSINSSVLKLPYGPALISIHDYWKTIALTRWTFVGKVMSLLFNKLSRLVIAFLPRSKHLLISRTAAVTIHSDFGGQENKVCHCFPLFPHLFAMK